MLLPSNYPELSDQWRYVAVSSILFWQSARVYKSRMTVFPVKGLVWDVKWTSLTATPRFDGDKLSIVFKFGTAPGGWDDVAICSLGKIEIFEMLIAWNSYKHRESFKICFSGPFECVPPVEWARVPNRSSIDKSSRISICGDVIGFRNLPTEIAVAIAVIWKGRFAEQS